MLLIYLSSLLMPQEGGKKVAAALDDCVTAVRYDVGCTRLAVNRWGQFHTGRVTPLCS